VRPGLGRGTSSGSTLERISWAASLGTEFGTLIVGVSSPVNCGSTRSARPSESLCSGGPSARHERALLVARVERSVALGRAAERNLPNDQRRGPATRQSYANEEDFTRHLFWQVVEGFLKSKGRRSRVSEKCAERIPTTTDAAEAEAKEARGGLGGGTEEAQVKGRKSSSAVVVVMVVGSQWCSTAGKNGRGRGGGPEALLFSGCFEDCTSSSSTSSTSSTSE
jgi:hypothetical protein